MMTVKIICVGKLKEKYLTEACREYMKRLGAFCSFSVEELPEERLPDNPSGKQIEAALSAEGKKILSAMEGKGRGYSFAMCIEGKQLSSEKLAEKIEQCAVGGYSRINFIIGSSFGIAPEVKSAADFRLSMSEMTFPHQLARVMLCEQIYRAFQINSGGKYHK